MVSALWMTFAVAYAGMLVILLRLPDLSALRDHTARANAFLDGVRLGRQK